jgi:alkylation response protein AidB-like acyl-CoA dehydrogenase
VTFDLTPQEVEWQERARTFATEKIRPAVAREWITDPYERFPVDVVRAGSEAGFRTCTVPPEYGGPEERISYLAEALIMEEFGAADPGIAMMFSHSMKDVRQVERFGTAEQRAWFYREYLADPEYLMASGGTEPNHGADWLLPYDNFHYDTQAVLDGDAWVLNGKKHCISNGAQAKMLLMFACTDPTKPFAEGTSMFMIPRSAPGIKRGSVHDKLGLRLVNNAEVIFDDCRIPKENLLGTLHRAIAERSGYIGENNLLSLAIKLGIARSAYDEALAYASQRVQGGKPIIGHQAVGLKLAEANALVEAIRSMLYRLAWMGDNPETYDHKFAALATWFAVESCFRAATLAYQVCGCSGAWLDYPAQKHVRDALIYFPNDGTHTIHLLRAHRMMQGGSSDVLFRPW